MKLKTSTSLLLNQWQAAPKFSALIGGFIDDWQAVASALTASDQPDKPAPELAANEGQLERMMHIDTAEGIWLDRIGVRLGVARPSVEIDSDADRFGFRDGNASNQPSDPDNVPFDSAPFKGALGDRALVPLNDTEYRAMIKARGVAVTSRGDFASFQKAVRFIDPSAEITDNRNMTITIGTNRKPALRLADDFGALPRAFGVKVFYTDPKGFGLDKAGSPLDIASFEDNT
ncbi:MAG: DUF2612 domain-containing protein [Gammaproteobacteria bacterium AqS3]|nr:DUF2612 domain-containing protein [Gammaproteobacteria bacterium AqS3]